MAMVALAGCSQVAPEYDPINWIGAASRDVSGWFSDKPEPAPPIVEPPPAEGRPIPNLATVPPPPLVTTGQRTQRQEELTRLQADRAAAAKADAALRAKTGGPAAPAGAPAGQVASATPPAAEPPSTPAETPSGAVMPQYGPNSLPPSLLPSTPIGAGPAPVIEVPSAAPTEASSPVAAKVASLLTTSERQGSVSFAPNAVSLSAAARNTLDAAAAAALESAGSVRLVPAEINGADVSAALVEHRTQALRAALASAGLAKDRIVIADVGIRRVDVYDVYVDY